MYFCLVYASLCISYFTVEEIPIIDRRVGEEVNRGQLCSFVSAWVMSGKVSQGNRKLRCDLKSCRHALEGAAEERQPHSCWDRRCLPTGAWLCLQLSSQFPPSQVLLAVRQLSGNPLIHTAILGNMCPGHESCTSNIPAIYLLVLTPCHNPLVILLSPSGQGAQPPRLGLWQSSLNSQLCILRLPGWSWV